MLDSTQQHQANADATRSSRSDDADTEPPASDDEPSAAEPGTLDTDDVFHLLQNERRRRVIEYLREHEGGSTEGVDMRDVVEDIAAREHDTSVDLLSSDERQRVYIALYQSHLPKLDDHDVIEYDQDRGWVRLAPGGEQTFPYLDLGDGDREAEGSTAGRWPVPAVGAAGLVGALATATGVGPLAASAGATLVVLAVALVAMAATVSAG
jgi:hypothetical protein